MIKSFSVLLLSAGMLLASPAQAQSRRELAERIDAVEVRIGAVEDSAMAGDPVAETLLRRMDELDYQVRDLTGEVERLAFENRRLRQQLEALERERMAPPVNGAPEGELDPDDEAVAWMRDGLDEDAAESRPGDVEPYAVVDPDDPHAEARAAATGVLGAPSSVRPADAAAETAPAADPVLVYENAQASLMDGDFGGAQAGFERFVEENPDHALTGEAWYWLGETFFVRSDFTGAADAYIAALRAQPDGAKAPDALVRLAASLYGMGRQDDACATLSRFDRQFPNAPAASRARASREAVRANCQ